MPLAVSLIDDFPQFTEFRERGEVREYRSLRIRGPRVCDICKQGYLPVQVLCLPCAMAHTETSAAVGRSHRLRQVTVTHDRTQEHLPLHLAEIVRLCQH